jgi:hypothetical protein
VNRSRDITVELAQSEREVVYGYVKAVVKLAKVVYLEGRADLVGGWRCWVSESLS